MLGPPLPLSIRCPRLPDAGCVHAAGLGTGLPAGPVAGAGAAVGGRRELLYRWVGKMLPMAVASRWLLMAGPI